MADLDKLVVQIESDSSSAVSGIDALATSLGKLKSATGGGLGLSSVAKNIGTIKNSLSGIGKIGSDTQGLTKAILTLKQLGGIKVSASIPNQIKNIGTALSTLNIGDGANKITELVSALKPLETLGKSSLSTTVNALNKLPEAMNKIDTKTLYGQVQSLTRIMKPLGDEMQKIANGFNAFPSRIQKIVQENEKLGNSNEKAGQSYVNLYAKIKMALGVIKTAAKGIASSVAKMNDYIEDVNLFTVAMGTYAGEAKEYAENVSEIMGIDPGEWMRNQGVFMTLATGFGVAGDRAYTMSKNLTQLTYDLSSFYNLPFDQAAQKLQSGLAGELEPLRRIGYDLSNARLEQEAYILGINKKVSAMTQAEKAELRYHAILTQVTVAQGDMARTLDTPANQLRILKSQINQASRAIGSIFIPMLNAVLPYLIAFAKIVRLVAEMIAGVFGFKLPEVDYSGVSAAAGGAEDYSDALGSAAENAKKLQKYTMGFDELNVIDTSSGSGGSEGTEAGGGGFDFELPEYDFLGDLTESRVSKIVDSMKEWLGLTDDINSWSDLFDTRLGQILQTAGTIGFAIGAWKISTGLVKSIAMIKLSLMTLSETATKGLTITAGVILTVTGVTLMFTGLKGVIMDGLDALDLTDLLLGGTSLILGGQMLGKAFGNAVIGAGIGAITAGAGLMFAGIYDAIANGADWTNLATMIGGVTVVVIGLHKAFGKLAGSIGLIVGGVAVLVTGIVDLVTNGYSMEGVIMVTVGALAILIGSVWAFNAALLANPVVWIVAAFIAIGAAFVILWNECEGFRNFWKSLWDKVKAVFSGFVSILKSLLNGIVTAFKVAWEAIKVVWDVVISFFSAIWDGIVFVFSTVVQFFCDVFTGAWGGIKAVWDLVVGFFTAIWNGITTVFSAVGDFFCGVFGAAWDGINAMWDGVVNGASMAWEGIKSVFSKVAEFFGNVFSAAWKGVVAVFSTAGEIFVAIKDGIITAFKLVVNGIIKGINFVVALPFEGLNKVLDKIYKIEILDVRPFKWLKWRAPVPQIPLLAEGGMPDTGQMFIAREAGPEMVGTIGRKSAVVNNDQIVESISYGVASANEESNSLLREQNSLLREMLAKESGVYLDGKRLTSSVEKYQRERGRVLVTGGAY